MDIIYRSLILFSMSFAVYSASALSLAPSVTQAGLTNSASFARVGTVTGVSSAANGGATITAASSFSVAGHSIPVTASAVSTVSGVASAVATALGNPVAALALLAVPFIYDWLADSGHPEPDVYSTPAQVDDALLASTAACEAAYQSCIVVTEQTVEYYANCANADITCREAASSAAANDVDSSTLANDMTTGAPPDVSPSVQPLVDNGIVPEVEPDYQVSAPFTVSMPELSTQMVSPDGSIQTSTSQIKNVVDGNTITSTIEKNVVTVDPVGNSSTVTTVTNPQLDISPETPPLTDCEKYPDNLGCQKFGVIPEKEIIPVIEQEVTLTYTSWGLGSCPGSVSLGNGVVFDYQPMCTALGYLNPILISAGLLAALYIVSGAVRD